jgi:hypothetical protein
METLIVFALYLYSSLWPTLHKEQYYALQESRFFALPQSQQLIPLNNPDTLFLDAAIFHASNEIRRKYGLPVFHYDPGLYLASSGHATSMVYRTFFNHTNPYSPYERTAQRRVELYTKRFKRIGENIGRYQTIVSGDFMIARWNNRQNAYEFLNESDLRLCQPFMDGLHAAPEQPDEPFIHLSRMRCPALAGAIQIQKSTLCKPRAKFRRGELNRAFLN